MTAHDCRTFDPHCFRCDLSRQEASLARQPQGDPVTTLYRPVLIESAEQAEALPAGTLARHAEGAGMDHAHKARPLGRDLWLAVGGNCTNAEMVGWTALVPVEAEEHEDEEYGILSDRYSPPDVIPAVGWQTLTPADRQYRRTVYRTPWEEA